MKNKLYKYYGPSFFYTELKKEDDFSITREQEYGVENVLITPGDVLIFIKYTAILSSSIYFHINTGAFINVLKIYVDEIDYNK